jgi:manganese/zinc/iron transport system permease protein
MGSMSSSFWIILTGAIVAGSCALLGSFLVLRRLSMLGDAISHAVLPGIVIAFALSNSRGSVTMFIGAVALGFMTTFLVQYLSQRGIEGNAAIGVTFTALFAVGVVLVSIYGERVDLDLDCVLYGEIAYSPFDTLILGGKFLGPRPVWINGILFAINLIVIGLFYKQFKLCAFDPSMAAAVGINVSVMHYLLMGLVSVTTVGAFESVGAILVVAMFIVPGATAYLLTDRLSRMLAIAVGLGMLSSVFGYQMARVLDCSIAGAMATVAGGFFLIAFFLSPRHGLVMKATHQWSLRRKLVEEDLLLWAGRRLEMATGVGAFTIPDVESDRSWTASKSGSVVRRLVKSGLLKAASGVFSLTEKGIDYTTDLLRRHRLYESYLHDLGYPTDHVHDPADRVEHHLSPDVIAALEQATAGRQVDPQGKPIPKPDHDKRKED